MHLVYVGHRAPSFTCAEAFTRLPRHGLTLNERLTFLACKEKKEKKKERSEKASVLLRPGRVLYVQILSLKGKFFSEI